MSNTNASFTRHDRPCKHESEGTTSRHQHDDHHPISRAALRDLLTRSEDLATEGRERDSMAICLQQAIPGQTCPRQRPNTNIGRKTQAMTRTYQLFRQGQISMDDAFKRITAILELPGEN